MDIMESELIHAKLNELLSYDSETGQFTWKVHRGGKATLGSVAGTINHGYVMIRICGRSYQASRLAWLTIHGEWPTGDLDHINGIPTDNRIANLRLCTVEQNAHNRNISSQNTSGYKGVSEDKRLLKNKFVAHIRVSGTLIRLGGYATKEEAAYAYDMAAVKYFGKFARTNKIIKKMVCGD